MIRKFLLWSACPGRVLVLLGGISERLGPLSRRPSQAGERVLFPSAWPLFIVYACPQSDFSMLIFSIFERRQQVLVSISSVSTPWAIRWVQCLHCLIACSKRGLPGRECLTLLEWTRLAQILQPELWSQLLPRTLGPAFLYVSSSFLSALIMAH